MPAIQSIYIHIPFCISKCNYCAFASYPGRENLHETYLNALAAEMESYKTFRADTLYIGGGTPSVLSAALLEKLFKNIENNFGPIKNFTESTFEANPESLTPEKLAILKTFGINRLSIGLQSLNDAHLKSIGRAHDRQTFLSAYAAARAAGFNNINIDLIAGLPGQTLQDFKDGVEEVASLAPEHFSIYGLQIEEGTKIYESGFNPDQNLMREMLEYAHDALPSAGYNHYEISNFARAGFESRHNNNYWLGGDYLGLGCAAASYLNGKRISNTENLDHYIKHILRAESPAEFEEELAGKERIGELVLIALRRLGGVEVTPEIENNFGREINNLIARGLLERAEKNIKLTREGLFLANEVFAEFVPPYED